MLHLLHLLVVMVVISYSFCAVKNLFEYLLFLISSSIFTIFPGSEDLLTLSFDILLIFVLNLPKIWFFLICTFWAQKTFTYIAFKILEHVWYTRSFNLWHLACQSHFISHQLTSCQSFYRLSHQVPNPAIFFMIMP